MGGFLRELKDLLTNAGCYLVRQGKGDHEVWYSPLTDRHFTVDAGTKSRHTANETLKQGWFAEGFLIALPHSCPIQQQRHKLLE